MLLCVSLFGQKTRFLSHNLRENACLASYNDHCVTDDKQTGKS